MSTAWRRKNDALEEDDDFDDVTTVDSAVTSHDDDDEPADPGQILFQHHKPTLDHLESLTIDHLYFRLITCQSSLLGIHVQCQFTAFLMIAPAAAAFNTSSCSLLISETMFLI